MTLESFAVLLCECVSDWPPKTRNIVLHVSATPIGYLGPALHQAAALDGNVIVINTGKFKNRRTCFAVNLRHFYRHRLLRRLPSTEPKGERDKFSLARPHKV